MSIQRQGLCCYEYERCVLSWFSDTVQFVLSCLHSSCLYVSNKGDTACIVSLKACTTAVYWHIPPYACQFDIFAILFETNDQHFL